MKKLCAWPKDQSRGNWSYIFQLRVLSRIERLSLLVHWPRCRIASVALQWSQWKSKLVERINQFRDHWLVASSVVATHLSRHGEQVRSSADFDSVNSILHVWMAPWFRTWNRITIRYAIASFDFQNDITQLRLIKWDSRYASFTLRWIAWTPSDFGIWYKRFVRVYYNSGLYRTMNKLCVVHSTNSFENT